MRCRRLLTILVLFNSIACRRVETPNPLIPVTIEDFGRQQRRRAYAHFHWKARGASCF